MAQTNKSGETVRERLKTSDLIPRLLCVVIAVIIWLYVMSNESPDYERTFSGVTVSIENAALLSSEYDLSVISGYGERADITVTGKKSDLISYSLEDIVPSVDVGSITTPGKHQLSISVTTPDGCTVGSVSPTSIEVYIDQIATKTLPVVVNISQVQHEQSITLGVPTPDVTAVTVSGPASVIEAASRAVVDLALGELTTGVTARGTLHVVTEDGATVDNPYLTLSQTSVGVTVPVYIEREIPITVGTKYGYFNEDNTRITVSPKSLTVRADPALLEGVDAFEIATIDENGIVTCKGVGTVTFVILAKSNPANPGNDFKNAGAKKAYFAVNITDPHDLDRTGWEVSANSGAISGTAGSKTAAFDNVFDPGVFKDVKGSNFGLTKPTTTDGEVWFVVDMQKEQTVNYFRLMHQSCRNTDRSCRWKKFSAILGSNDGETFTQIASDVEVPNLDNAPGIDPNDGGSRNIDKYHTCSNVKLPNTVKYRYLKFVGKKDCFTGTAKTCQFSEMYLGLDE